MTWADVVVRWNDHYRSSAVEYAQQWGWSCPADTCAKEFRTENGLLRHMKQQEHEPPYFFYARGIKLTDVTCECGYRPDPSVDNPVKCYRDHRRRVHREEWIRNDRKMYVITIDLPL